jgi:hypothetical protein
MEKSKALPVCFFDSSAFWFSLSPSHALRPIEELFRQQHQKKKIDPIWPREKTSHQHGASSLSSN